MEEQLDPNNNTKAELWGLTIKDLFYKYVRFLPLFLLTTAIALLLAFAYLRYSTRIYSASGTLAIEQAKPSNNRADKVEDIISGGNRSSTIQNEMEIVKSKPLMERVVQNLNLQWSYNSKGKVRGLNVYKQAPFVIKAFEIADSSAIFELDIKFKDESHFTINNESQVFSFNQVFKNSNGVFRLVKTGVPQANGEFNVVWQPTKVVATSLVGNVKVQPKTPGTAILSISFQATNPIMASDIVNALMVQYDSMTVEQNNYSADQIINFISARLIILENELDTLQLVKLKYQQENDLINLDKQSNDYFEKIKEMDKMLNDQKFNVQQANAIEKYLIDVRNQFSKVPSALTVQDATLIELVSTYNKFQIQRQNWLDANIPPQNPAIKETEGMIEKVRGALVENITNIRQSYVASMGVISDQNQAQEARLRALPNKVKTLLEMERQINTKLALYSLLEGKREEAMISRASTISNSTIIDGALPNNTPVKPDKKAIQIIAVLIGLGVPALLIFMAEVLNDKVSTRFDIERITNAPIMGEIGHSYADNVLIVNKSSRSMVAEQFRIIRSNLQYVLNKNENPVILVTSSYSGEGKSFISTNMGAVIALTGKRTVILEFDIRKPKVLSGLGMPKGPGISNYLVGKGELKNLVAQVPGIDNLFVLGCGPIPPNPSELLLDQKVAEMFEWLRKEFDVIVIDTAPIGMVSDAMTLGKFADCTLYLVRQGHTFKKQVTLIDELYRAVKLPKVSIVINDVKVKPGYGYYGYGRYGYGYGYAQKKGQGTYYEEDAPPVSRFERWLKKWDIKKVFGKKSGRD